MLDGAALGALWLPSVVGAAASLRVGVHVRMGDMHIAAARDGPSKADSRNADVEELRMALRLVGAEARALASTRPLLVFACADTAAARELVRDALATMPVFSAPLEPVHIGYKETFSRAGARRRAPSRARPHSFDGRGHFCGFALGFFQDGVRHCRHGGARSAILSARGRRWGPIEPGQGVWTDMRAAACAP